MEIFFLGPPTPPPLLGPLPLAADTGLALQLFGFRRFVDPPSKIDLVFEAGHAGNGYGDAGVCKPDPPGPP